MSSIFYNVISSFRNQTRKCKNCLGIMKRRTESHYSRIRGSTSLENMNICESQTPRFWLSFLQIPAPLLLEIALTGIAFVPFPLFRASKDSAGSQSSDRSQDGEGRAQSKGLKGGSKKRVERRPSARLEEKKPSGPDLLSGDDPFPTPAPRPSVDDFSSFASFAPQVYQGGVPIGGGGMTHQGPNAQAGSQIVPFGFMAPESQGQQQPHLRQQQFASSEVGWGQKGMSEQQQGMSGQQQGMSGQQPGMFEQQQQWRGYDQTMGQGMTENASQQQQPMQMQSYVGQSDGQGQPYQQGFQQQTYGQPQQQPPQESQLPQTRMYPEYQACVVTVSTFRSLRC